MKNLTRDEARVRAVLLEVHSYEVALDLSGGAADQAATFTSRTTVRFTCREPGTATFAELDAELVTATLNGQPVGQLLGNRLPLIGLAADNVLVVEARCAYSRTGEGLHRFTDPADGLVYLWAMSFLDDAQRMFACFDQPDLKATIALTVDAPPEWSVVGNARGARDGGRWRFATTERISTYLFTVAAGPWHSVRERAEDVGTGGVELGLHCRQSLAVHLDSAELFETTRQCFALQERLFGRPYPFGDTYDQLFVPEFNHGAMENPGAVTFTEDFLFRSRVTDDARRKRAMVIAHEMAHMWFGDLVTMRWWDDLWLNESFAELLGFLTVDRATRHRDAWVDFSTSRKAWGYRADQLPSTHPVQGDVPDTRAALLNFDGISYSKGASVLRQLMATVGEEPFFTAVRAYLHRHAHGSTEFADLLAELTTASGRDLDGWAAAWLQTTGVSTLRVVDGELRQSAASLRPHRVGVGLYDRAGAGPGAGAGAGLQLRQRFELDLGGASAPLPAAAGADLVLPNDGDLTFAKIRFDDRSLETVLGSLRELADPLARALCWAGLWDACRDAELSAADFVRAVLSGVTGEDDPAVVASLLERAGTAARLYSLDGSAVLASVAELCWTADAAPGSDLQLAYLRGFAGAAGPDQAARLAAVLDGTSVPVGVAVDTDLRWTLLSALAALGAVSEAQLETELAGDRTAAGHRQALAARASCPDEAAKQWAWTAVTREPTGALALSNAELHAIAGGLWRSGQDDLLRPYLQRYADDLPMLWRTRSPEVVGRLTERLFPSTLVEPAVLERTAVLLEAQQPAGLRRIVSEQRDDLARALAARAAGAVVPA